MMIYPIYDQTNYHAMNQLGSHEFEGEDKEN
jgi:hypothetical protein